MTTTALVRGAVVGGEARREYPLRIGAEFVRQVVGQRRVRGVHESIAVFQTAAQVTRRSDNNGHPSPRREVQSRKGVDHDLSDGKTHGEEHIVLLSDIKLMESPECVVSSPVRFDLAAEIEGRFFPPIYWLAISGFKSFRGVKDEEVKLDSYLQSSDQKLGVQVPQGAWSRWLLASALGDHRKICHHGQPRRTLGGAVDDL